jgi:hypothetical protein
MKYLWFLIFTFGCSVEKIGVRSTTNLLEKASYQILLEPSLKHFHEASLSSIKLLEGFWYIDQSNKKLISLLIKTYAGYGFAIGETELYKKQINGTDSEFDKLDALVSYSKAIRYGTFYLKTLDKNQEGILFEKPEILKKFLQQSTTDKDLVALFYIAQSFGSIINLNRTNMELVSFLPNVKTIFDFVCEKSPNIEMGGCELFYSVYEGSRPKLLGGNPDLGKKLFNKFIKKYPKNLLARVAYLQHIVIPEMDQKSFSRESHLLKKDFIEFNKYKNRSLDIRGKNKFENHSNFNLYNAIAEERFLTMLKNEKNLF